MRRFLAAIPLLAFVLIAGTIYAQMRQDLPQVVTDPKQAFVTGSIVVKGEGAAPSDKGLSAAQKRILALRAAKVTALREIAEIIDGVAVSGDTTVVNAAVQSDTVRASVQGLVKGAQVIKEVYDPLSEMAAVYVSVPMTGPNGVLGALLPQVIPVLPQVQAPLYQPQAPVETRDARYDGLILDVRDRPFRPALINRVVAKNGEIIYDPAKVAQNILVERGAAEYTNDIGKAKALLGERGSSNPLVVRANGVVRSTDVELAPEDAGAVYSANQASNFLEGAKVVFVLK